MEQKEQQKRRKHYETIIIFSPDLNASDLQAAVAKNMEILAQGQSALLRHDDWGKLKMAYEINKHAMGHYFYFRFISEAEALTSFERNLKLDSSVLRFRTIRLSQDLTKDQEQEIINKAPQEASTSPALRAEDEEGMHYSHYSAYGS